MMTTRDYHAERCCCGRIEDWTEPVILGERLHERLGGEGAFCGPVLHHDLRDQKQEIKKLRAALGRAACRFDAMAGGADEADMPGLVEKATAWAKEAREVAENNADRLLSTVHDDWWKCDKCEVLNHPTHHCGRCGAAPPSSYSKTAPEDPRT